MASLLSVSYMCIQLTFGTACAVLTVARIPLVLKLNITLFIPRLGVILLALILCILVPGAVCIMLPRARHTL